MNSMKEQSQLALALLSNYVVPSIAEGCSEKDK